MSIVFGESNDSNNFLLQDFYSLEMGLKSVPPYINIVSEVWIKKRIIQRDKGTDGQDFSSYNQDSYQFGNFATNIINTTVWHLHVKLSSTN